jgi:hypothetical protein
VYTKRSGSESGIDSRANKMQIFHKAAAFQEDVDTFMNKDQGRGSPQMPSNNQAKLTDGSRIEGSSFAYTRPNLENKMGFTVMPQPQKCLRFPYVSREQRCLCSGLAQGRLSFGSGLLTPAHACSRLLTPPGAHPIHVTRRSQGHCWT